MLALSSSGEVEVLREMRTVKIMRKEGAGGVRLLQVPRIGSTVLARDGKSYLQVRDGLGVGERRPRE